MQILEELQRHLAEVKALGGAAAVLGWDQQTYMPTGGAGARAAQFAALSRVIHQQETGDATARLLERAEREGEHLEADSDDAAYLRMARRDFDQATKLPEALVAEIASVTTLAHEEWAAARKDNDYARFAPWLAKILGLTRSVADHLGYAECRYDALLDQYEPGMKTSQVREMFDTLKP